jgi:hypothetical protein
LTKKAKAKLSLKQRFLDWVNGKNYVPPTQQELKELKEFDKREAETQEDETEDETDAVMYDSEDFH